MPAPAPAPPDVAGRRTGRPATRPASTPARPSQRTGGYRGGIKPGTPATSPTSATLETVLRQAVTIAREAFPHLHWRPGYTATELADLLGVPAPALAGLRPDGGIFTDPATGTPVLAAEAKKQGPAGNAIERWYKNHALLAALGTPITLTFCLGEGFFDANPAQRILQTALALDPGDRARLASGRVWNFPAGRTRLYRYRSLSHATADIPTVLTAALHEAGLR
jgi:hypothetical protein